MRRIRQRWRQWVRWEDRGFSRYRRRASWRTDCGTGEKKKDIKEISFCCPAHPSPPPIHSPLSLTPCPGSAQTPLSPKSCLAPKSEMNELPLCTEKSPAFSKSLNTKMVIYIFICHHQLLDWMHTPGWKGQDSLKPHSTSSACTVK